MVKEYIVNSKVHGKHVILLDDEDYNRVMKENIKIWINYAPTVHGCYAIFWRNNKRVRLHRWVVDCPPDKMVDHINHNTLDNRKDNLRIVTHFGNQQNRKGNKSGKTGVYWSTRDKKYVARIGRKWLGASKNFNEAVKMRLEAEQKEKMK